MAAAGGSGAPVSAGGMRLQYRVFPEKRAPRTVNYCRFVSKGRRSAGPHHLGPPRRSDLLGRCRHVGGGRRPPGSEPIEADLDRLNRLVSHLDVKVYGRVRKRIQRGTSRRLVRFAPSRVVSNTAAFIGYRDDRFRPAVRRFRKDVLFHFRCNIFDIHR
jgi:hypothetical protein